MYNCAFLCTFSLGLKKDRVHRLVTYFREHGVCRPEHRGGARQTEKYAEQRDRVKADIEKFSCKASHYGRRGNESVTFRLFARLLLHANIIV